MYKRQIYTCTKCGDSYSEVVGDPDTSETGHQYETQTVKAADCETGTNGIGTVSYTHLPELYDLELRLKYPEAEEDLVWSYFGMREIRIEGRNLLLNGSPLYQRLILDQGYWPDSHLTPPSEAALIEDIEKIQRLGYNGVRKRQKIEDERLLYWGDVKGLLVWSEMAAAYTFDDTAVSCFMQQWTEIVRQNYSHPCIITWTPVNESWGVPQIKTDPAQQHFAQAIYHLTKAMDPMRPVRCV